MGIVMSRTWTLSSLVIANEGVVACALDGDSALLDLDTSRYYKLNPVGTMVWQAIEKPTSVEALRSMIADAHDVDAETCARDLDTLLESLMGAGLVNIVHAQVG